MTFFKDTGNGMLDNRYFGMVKQVDIHTFNNYAKCLLKEICQTVI